MKIPTGIGLNSAFGIASSVFQGFDPTSWVYLSAFKIFPQLLGISPAGEIYNADGVRTFTWDTGVSSPAFPKDQWINVLLAYNTTQPAHQKTGLIFLGDTQVNDPTDNLDDDAAFNTAFNQPPFAIGFNVDGATIDVADIWFTQDSFIDLTIEANRRKFHDANGKPVDLGASGELPLGTSPTVFLRASGSDSSTFLTNRGYAGNFTAAAGSLTIAPTSPSD